MKITIPIYIEQQQEPGRASSVYQVRPLFFQEPVSRDEELQRAVAKFSKSMRRALKEAGKQKWQNDLGGYSFAPDLEDHLLTFKLDLKTRKAECKLLFVTLNSLGQRIAFSPNLPQVWFEIERGESLHSRAEEVLTRFFRDNSKNRYTPNPEDVSVRGRAWTSAVDLEFNPPVLAKTSIEEWRAHLGGPEVLDGEAELQQVGRCLDWLYPDDLNRVVAREREIDELSRLLLAKDRRPVLLIGPRMAGKTALIEEYVYRVVAGRKSHIQSNDKNNVWQIAPQRLISGMSYVGQWENRLIAILKEAKERDHILVFDDLIGLFRAGISRDSKLNVAQVIKPYLERRDLRVVGEATPESWRVLREQDRGFADLFHVLPVPEPGEDETVEMLLGLVRQLEPKHRCGFELDALPAALDLQRRYVRDAAFPGKAAAFLRQLAIKHRGAVINRFDVISEFRAKSGLAPWMLVETHEMQRDEMISSLEKLVIGQKAAVEACADVLCIAKARLNDPNRPLASFLFLGPTGVGKTQCAKALATMLFGSEERLVRFDMNEFVSHDAVARLAGSFDQPEGLLTSAVRRQPFSIVLLDEVEKAHRDVFNLLLQVMGDGRLTDALGRTADFTNTILILTSNLGVKEASADLGFQSLRANEASIYVQAAEKFFSPEFFNRLDRIVPFERLNREAIGLIAYALINQIFTREGLVRRKTLLRVDQRALERVIDAGFHPKLGARALKRAIENQLTQPLAARLSSLPMTSPALIDVLPASGSLQIRIQELLEAAPHEHPPITALLDDPDSTIDSIEEFIGRFEREIAVMQPQGPISIDDVEPKHYRYFALTERVRRLRNRCAWLRGQYESSARASSRLGAGLPRIPRSGGHKATPDRNTPRQLLKQLVAAEDIHAYLRELASQPRNEDHTLREQLADTIRETAMMSRLAQDWEENTSSQALILIRAVNSFSVSERARLKLAYLDLFGTQFGLEVISLTSDNRPWRRADDWILVSGRHAPDLALTEMGTHLHFDESERMTLIQVKVFALGPGDRPRAVIAAELKKHKRWIDRLIAGEAGVDDDPHSFDPVVRIYSNSGGNSVTTVDLRSGLTTQRFPSMDDFRAFLGSSLPLPAELNR